MHNYIRDVVENCPQDWLKLTTHRLDIYNEDLAKKEFLDHFEALYNKKEASTAALSTLPTAYDYIRLGHPLSCVLEWVIAQLQGIDARQVISFSSPTMPIFAVLRRNLLANKNTQIVYSDRLPDAFDGHILKQVYGYNFEVKHINHTDAIPEFDGTTIFVSEQEDLANFELQPNCDACVAFNQELGSILVINSENDADIIPAIQHVRRRETIAMTPAHCHLALQKLVELPISKEQSNIKNEKAFVVNTINDITNTQVTPLLGSSGLSTQYAIMMGLIHQAKEKYEDKQIYFIVPPNCYGGTNDQARRVAACIENVDIMDLPVDGDHNMVQSLETVLNAVAEENAVPYIIAEIPTNPRVEVPNLKELKAVLSKKRTTAEGDIAIDPIFILDQTFCPNVDFLGENMALSEVQTIAYVSGSKFPSGGKCTAGYCVANSRAASSMAFIARHLKLCGNEATDLQIKFLAQQLPSMLDRIKKAYQNTRDFVNFIEDKLPTAKINFVSEELAKQGFTPSVFSLDLPTKGATHEEREAYKRALNHTLIRMMITQLPHESKHCVSYGQLKGVYWTIPATSTQGTTKEDDKDYIARVSMAPEVDLDAHKKVFVDFVEQL